MDVRRFMWENRKHYDFVVVSADKNFLKNSFSADTDLGRLQFERVSFKSLMISLLTHPGVSLTRKQHDRIVKTASQMGAVSVSSAVWKNTIPRSRKVTKLQSS